MSTATLHTNHGAIAVELFDERLTTVSAHQALTAGGTRGRNQRAVVDQTAAAILLQSYLDSLSAPLPPL